MSLSTRKAAERQAREKRILLNEPRKWKIRVWENLGWHWSLRRGNLSLYFSQYGNEVGTFSALLSDGRYEGVGESFWTNNFHHKDPNKVVENQLKIAKAFLKKCQNAIESVEN